MSPLSITDILKLSVAERIQLVEDIWDSIAEVPEALDLPPAQRKELERRLAAYHENPAEGSPWDTVKNKMK